MKKWFLSTLLMIQTVTTVCFAASFHIERWQTSKGTPVVFYRAMEVPMLYLNVAFRAGSAYDGEQFGISALTAELLNQSSGNFNENQVAEKLADVGAQYNVDVSQDMAVLQLKTLSQADALKNAVDVFELIMSKPNFKERAFSRVRNQQLMTIAKAQDSPDEVANIMFFHRLYQHHPYGHPIEGEAKILKQLDVYDVRRFYKQYYQARNAVIVMVGAIDNDKAHQIAEQLTRNLPEGKEAPPVVKAQAMPEAETINVDFPSSQTVIRLGQLGIDHSNPNYFPLLVGNYILGGGALVSRLPQEVREKQGLSYGVASQFIPMPATGPFLISLSTKNSQAKKAVAITEKTLSDFVESGPTEEELQAAKQYIEGSFPVSLSSNASIANVLLRMSFYHLPDNYLSTYVAHIQQVSVDDIKAAFKTLINTEKMLLISVGDSQKIVTQHHQHVEFKEDESKAA